MESEIIYEVDWKDITYYLLQSLGNRGPEDWRDHGSTTFFTPTEAKDAARTMALETGKRVRVVRFGPSPALTVRI